MMSQGNYFIFNKNDEAFKLLFHNNPNPMWVYDKKSLEFLDVNSAAELIYGYSKEEFLKLKLLDIRPSEDLPKLYQHLENTKSDSRSSFYTRHKYKDGTIVYVDLLIQDVNFEGKDASLIMINNNPERIKIQEALQKSEERYRALFESAGSGIAYCSTDGRLILINEIGAKNFRGIPSDFQAKFLYDILPNTLTDSIKNIINSVVNNKMNSELEIQTDNNSEKAALLLAHFQPLIDAKRCVNGIQIIFHDITKIKIIEKALLDSETRFRHLFEDITQVPVQGYDINHKVIFWNKASEMAYGYKKEEAMGKKLEDLIIPEHMKEDVFNSIEDFYLKNIHIPAGEIGLKRKDGSIVYMYSSHVIIKNYDGNKEMYCIDVNMTKRIEAEQKVALHSSMLDAVGQAVIASDTNGKIIYLNRAAEQLYKWPKEEVLNKNITQVISSAHIKKNAEDIIRKIKKGEIWAGEFTAQKSDGTIFPAYGTNSPLFNSCNELVGIIGVSIDISDIKKKENELKSAKEKAEEMSKIKSAFLTNMSHELRTPLVGILGFSEILNSELEDAGHKHIAGSILFSGKRLLTTLNAILDLSKIEANRLELNYSIINVISEIQSITRTFEGLAQKKGLSLAVDYEGTDFAAELDRSLFRQILENLIHNAIKFSESGKIRISANKGAENFIIKVKDTGIGIPYDSLNLIFDEFRQVSEGFGRHFEGTGIGLTLTKKFVNLLNGSIFVESELNEGTVFTIRLPLFQDQVKTVQSNQEFLFENIKGSNNMNIKILLVEDDAINREVICRYLKNVYDVTPAENGNEAIDLASRNKYDLILMDINLGKGLNGIEAAKKIKEYENYNGTPIVALTAYAMKGDRENFLASGFVEYISKPFLKDELIYLINNLFKPE